MDFFAHGLWTGAVAKAANQKIKKPLNTWLAVFWGIFPDLFAFSIPFILLLWNLLTDQVSFSDWPRPETTEPPRNRFAGIGLANNLYQFSHSLIIFAAVFFAIWLIFRRPIWEMAGWLLHVLIDIPTHSYRFYPTPFLWPLSDFKIDAFSWANPWFMLINYTAIITAYILLRKKRVCRNP